MKTWIIVDNFDGTAMEEYGEFDSREAAEEARDKMYGVTDGYVIVQWIRR